MTARGVAITHCTETSAPIAEFSLCEFLPFDEATRDDDHDRSLKISMLTERIETLGLKNMPCTVVMPLGSYQLFLVEAPKVQASELADAIRWKVKDLINYPIDEAAVDAFLLPDDSSSGGNSMAYAVVVKKDYVRFLVDAVKASGLILDAIDIAELSLNNLLSWGRSDDDLARSLALVSFHQGMGSLHVYKAGNLYLSRQFKLDYNAGLLDDLPAEALVLELQRSLDYYERQMRQVPPRTLYFCGDNISEDKITDTLRDNLSAKIELLSVDKNTSLTQATEEHIRSLCLSAMGAALRSSEGAL
jgi:MSHA biogenesis protein MshI